MSAQTPKCMHRCANGYLLTEDGYRPLSVHDHSAQRAMTLVAYKQDGCAAAGKIVPEVMENAAAGTHASARHDHARAFDVIQSSRIVRRFAEIYGVELIA